MAVDVSHPAVRAVLEALDNPELIVRAGLDRDDEVVAVEGHSPAPLRLLGSRTLETSQLVLCRYNLDRQR